MLGYTDEQTWKLTPRQFSVQVSVHEDIMNKLNGAGKVPNSAPVKEATSGIGYIDQIPGW